MAYAYGLMTMYGLTAQIGTAYSAGSWTYSDLGNGIENIAEALNETVQQYFFMDDDGFAKNHVTGMAIAFTLTGRRVYGDPAQDYIFSKKFGLDTERQSSFKLSWLDASSVSHTITCNCTIANMQEWSGNTTDDSAISFEIRFDGKPTVIDAAGALPPLSVVSVAGSTSGDTAIYVNPLLADGDSYKYKVGDVIALPSLGETVSAGYTAWDGSDEITAATGTHIAIIEVDGDSKAVKGGIATVTANG